MSANVKPIPDNYDRVVAYLVVRGAASALEYYQRAFGAKERMRIDAPDNRIGHAEFTIGETIFMIADEFSEMGIVGPATLEGSPVSFCMYVEDVDVAVETAVNAGGTISRPIETKFYGDRSGSVKDPFGYEWHLMTHIEDVSSEEMQRRAKEAMQQSS